MSVIKVETDAGLLEWVHTGAGSGAKSELPPSSSKTESSIMEESSMINTSKQMERNRARWGKRSPSPRSWSKRMKLSFNFKERINQAPACSSRKRVKREAKEKRERIRGGGPVVFFARGSRDWQGAVGSFSHSDHHSSFTACKRAPNGKFTNKRKKQSSPHSACASSRQFIESWDRVR